MVVRRVGAFSLAKVLGVVYALMALILGAITAFFYLLIGLLGFASGSQDAEGAGAVLGFGVAFGIGALIFYPVILGIVGFIGGLITAVIYNAVARLAGGLELDLEEKSRVY